MLTIIFRWADASEPFEIIEDDDPAQADIVAGEPITIDFKQRIFISRDINYDFAVFESLEALTPHRIEWEATARSSS